MKTQKAIAIQLTPQPQTFSKSEVDGELTWQLQSGSNQIANTTDLPVPMDVDLIDDSNVKLYLVTTDLNSRTSTNQLISKFINFCSTENVLAGAVARATNNICTRNKLQELQRNNLESRDNLHETYPVILDPNLVYSCQKVVYNMKARVRESKDVFQLIKSWTFLENEFRTVLHDRVTGAAANSNLVVE